MTSARYRRTTGSGEQSWIVPHCLLLFPRYSLSWRAPASCLSMWEGKYEASFYSGSDRQRFGGGESTRLGGVNEKLLAKHHWADSAGQSFTRSSSRFRYMKCLGCLPWQSDSDCACARFNIISPPHSCEFEWVMPITTILYI